MNLLSSLHLKVYYGVLRENIVDEFRGIVFKAQRQFVNDRINARLKSAGDEAGKVNVIASDDETPMDEPADDNNGIVTTQEEVDGFDIVRAILSELVDIERVVMRDTKSYCGILLDDNNRKPICR